MLNFISYSICSFFIFNVLKNPHTQNPESLPLQPAYSLPNLGGISEQAPVNLAFFIALFTVFCVWYVLFKTAWGFEVRLIGQSSQTAERAGINVKSRIIQAMCLSGGLAGLVAINEIMGFAHKFRDQFSSGFGFVGIAVALLGRNRPIGIVAAAIFLAALQKGSLELEIDSEKITRDFSFVMQALVVLFVASEAYWFSVFRKLFSRKLKA